jgi:hypothetical protein
MKAITALFYGGQKLAEIVPDKCYPKMYRIAWPRGGLSGMVNLDRAKDAAAAIAERGPPGRNRRFLHWKRLASNSRLGAAGLVFSEGAISRTPAAKLAGRAA